MEEKYFLNRHSFKPNEDNPESEKYKGLSEKGVEQARQYGMEKDREMIERAPEGSVIFFGGATEAARTVSTSELRGEGLKEAFRGNDQVLVITKGEVEEIVKNAKSFSRGIEKIAQIIEENKDKKVVVDYPMFIKELSFGKHWGFFSSEGAKYYNYLFEKNNSDDYKSVVEWIRTQGKTDKPDLQGPNPEDMAKEYLTGLKRLRDFVNRHTTDRPIIVGGNAHCWELDIFIIKMAKGEVTLEGFDEISGGKLTNENEGTYLEIDGGQIKISYRGKTYERKFDSEE